MFVITFDTAIDNKIFNIKTTSSHLGVEDFDNNELNFILI